MCCVGSLGGAKPPKEVVVKARSEGASGKGIDTAEAGVTCADQSG